MKSTWFVLFIVVVLSSCVVAQPEPLISWVQFYGDGCWGANDEPESFARTHDGGFVFCGTTWRFLGGQSQIWLSRTDSMGNLLWEQGYGTGFVHALHMLVMTDGSFVIGGSGSSDGSPYTHYCLLKTDSTGSQIFWRFYEQTGMLANPWGLVQTPDGGFALAGHDSGDMCLLKTDSIGMLQWIRHYDLGGAETANSLLLTHDGGFLLTGNREPYDTSRLDWLAVRTDSVGDTLWTRITQDPGGANRSAGTARELLDGGLIVIGVDQNSTRIGLTHIATDGSLLWYRTISLPDSNIGSGMFEVLDDGLIMAGSARGGYNGAPPIACLAKADLNGIMLWHRTFQLRDYSSAGAVFSMPDGSFVMGGLVRCVTPDLVLPPDAYLLRTGPDGNPVDNHIVSIPHTFTLSAYPNPFNPTTRISFELPKTEPVTLSIFNLQGRLAETLLDKTCEAGKHEITFDGAALPSGVYFARVTTPSFIQTEKLLLLK